MDFDSMGSPKCYCIFEGKPAGLSLSTLANISKVRNVQDETGGAIAAANQFSATVVNISILEIEVL